MRNKIITILKKDGCPLGTKYWEESDTFDSEKMATEKLKVGVKRMWIAVLGKHNFVRRGKRL